MLSKEQISDSKKCADLALEGKDMECFGCSCSVCIGQIADIPRVEVLKYSMAMEIELKENDYKGGWKDCSLDFLIEKLDEEVEELKEVSDRLGALVYNNHATEEELIGQRKRILSEAADVGNIAMMIADICNTL